MNREKARPSCLFLVIRASKRRITALEAFSISLDRVHDWYKNDTVMNDLLLLAALLEGPKHGYALKKQAGLILGQTDMHNNLIYPSLRRFVSNRWVTRRKTAGERGKVRQVYSLTPAGRRSIVEKVCDFEDRVVGSAEEFRLRVGFFSILTSSARERILEKREAYLVRRAERFEPLQKEVEPRGYASEVIRFRQRQIEAELAWIERLRHLGR
jgi:DNA-binding PadR family transcriptional regulator